MMASPSPMVSPCGRIMGPVGGFGRGGTEGGDEKTEGLCAGEGLVVCEQRSPSPRNEPIYQSRRLWQVGSIAHTKVEVVVSHGQIQAAMAHNLHDCFGKKKRLSASTCVRARTHTRACFPFPCAPSSPVPFRFAIPINPHCLLCEPYPSLGRRQASCGRLRPTSGGKGNPFFLLGGGGQDPASQPASQPKPGLAWGSPDDPAGRPPGRPTRLGGRVFLSLVWSRHEL
jgi:hypothetical protein